MTDRDDRELHEEKRIYELFRSLHDDPNLVRLFEGFGMPAFRRSSVLEGFDKFLRENNFRGERCVEIGTFRGLTAIVLSRYFDEVVSIDILNEPVKHELVQHLGITNVRFIDVADNEEKASVIQQLKFDAAFSDGDHAHDTQSDFNLVKRCGRVMFHEYWPAQPPVVELVDSLAKRADSRVTIENKWALWERLK